MSDELTGRRISSVENVFYFISALIDDASNDFTRTGGRNNKGKTNKERIKKINWKSVEATRNLLQG